MSASKSFDFDSFLNKYGYSAVSSPSSGTTKTTKTTNSTVKTTAPTNTTATTKTSSPTVTSTKTATTGTTASVASIQAQLADLQAQQAALAKYGLTDTNQLQKSSSGYAPVSGASGNTAYTIKSGDTLSQLAVNNGTTVAALMAANPSITDPNKIYAGATLNIPGKSVLPSANAGVMTSTAAMAAKNTAAADATKAQAETLQNQNNTIADLSNKKTIAQLQSEIEGAMGNVEKPETYSALDTYKTLSGQYNISGLQSSVNTLKNELLTAQDSLTNALGMEEGRLASTDIISSRQREITNQMNKSINTIQRSYSLAQDNLNAAVSTVTTLTQLGANDYATQKAAYDSAFSQALQLQSIVYNQNQDVQNRADALLKEQKSTAAANLSAILQTASASGDVTSFDDLPTELQNSVKIMAASTGTPMEVINYMLSAPKEEDYQYHFNEIDNGDGTASTQVITTSKNGIVGVKNFSAGVASTKSSNLTEGEQLRQATADMAKAFIENGQIGPDTYTSPEAYKVAKNAWITESGYTAAKFDEIFSYLVNPADPQDYGITPTKSNCTDGMKALGLC